MRQGSLQRGGSMLKKESSSIVGLLPARKMTAHSSCGGGTIDCMVAWGEKTLRKDGSLEVLVPSRR